MNIVHITSPGFRQSGKFIFDVHLKLLSKGHNSYVVCQADNICREETCSIKNTYSYHSRLLEIYSRLKNKIRRILIKFRPDYINNFMFDDLNESRNQLLYRDIVEKFPFKPDAVIFYALQDFVTSRTINKIYNETKARIYWFIFDIAPLTGGCHYSWGCGKFEEMCGSCPQMHSKNQNDITRRNWEKKYKNLNNIDISILACSEWLYQNAERSSLFRDKPIHKWMIPMSPDFQYKAKSIARRELNLDPEKDYILFGAVKTDDERKGLKYLIEAFKILKQDKMIDRDFEILLLGKNSDILNAEIPYQIIPGGFITERDVLIQYYQAAYLVVVPSIEDGGPIMISESMACGTPVVSFNMGSSHDLVISGQTGYKAELKDSIDMAKGIAMILNMSKEDYSRMSENCLAISSEKTNLTNQINKLIDICGQKA